MGIFSKRCLAITMILGAAGLGACNTMSYAPVTANFAAAAPGMPLDANGYIRNWMVLGPIRFGGNYVPENIDNEQIPHEAMMMPRVGDKQKVMSDEPEGVTSKVVEKELTWQKMDAADFFFDMNVALDLESSDGCGGYAVTYLDAAAEMKNITFSLCSNDNGRVILNGESVYTFVGDRATAEDVDQVKGLTLKKGMNVVVFKVWNTANNWQGNIRVLGSDGKPVTGVVVKVPG